MPSLDCSGVAIQAARHSSSLYIWQPNQSLMCPESCRLLVGESPTVVTVNPRVGRRPRSRLPVLPGDRLF